VIYEDRPIVMNLERSVDTDIDDGNDWSEGVDEMDTQSLKSLVRLHHRSFSIVHYYWCPQLGPDSTTFRICEIWPVCVRSAQTPRRLAD